MGGAGRMACMGWAPPPTKMAANKFVVRGASLADLKVANRFVTLQKNWHFGPDDLSCAYAFDPSGFFVGELDGEVIGHIDAVKYPGHSAFIGMYIVQKELRGRGYGKKIWDTAWKSLDHTYTIGLDAALDMVSKYESYGFHTVWKSSFAKLNLEKVVKSLATAAVPSNVSIKSIQTIEFDKLVEYDASVFGAPRHNLVEKWIKIAGSFGWGAVDKSGNVVGYTIVRRTINYMGAEFGLSMAPLYANNDSIAKSLLKVAAETCLANEVVSEKEFEVIHDHGVLCGEHALQLMTEMEAELRPSGARMYTKGIPHGRATSKIYGIFHPGFD